jgi:hypothetical protein
MTHCTCLPMGGYKSTSVQLDGVMHLFPKSVHTDAFATFIGRAKADIFAKVVAD